MLCVYALDLFILQRFFFYLIFNAFVCFASERLHREDDWIAQCLHCAHRSAYEYKDTYLAIEKVRHNVYIICDCDSRNVKCNLSVVKGLPSHGAARHGTAWHIRTPPPATPHMNNAIHGWVSTAVRDSLLFRHSFCRLCMSQRCIFSTLSLSLSPARSLARSFIFSARIQLVCCLFSI